MDLENRNIFEITSGATVQFNPGGIADQLVNYRDTAKYSTQQLNDLYRDGREGLKIIRSIQVNKLIKETEPYVSAHSKFLDVGCGEGDFLAALNKSGIAKENIQGIEPSYTGQEKYVFNGTFQDYQKLNSATFDVISLLDVLEHFTDPTEILELVKTKLNDKGTLLIKVPNKDSLIYKLAKNLRTWAPQLSRNILSRLFQVEFPPPHYFYFDQDSLESLLLKSSFRIVKVSYMSEIPFKGIAGRLWGVSPIKKLLLIPAFLVLKLLSSGKRNDTVVVWAKLN